MDIYMGLFSLRPYPGSKLFDFCLSKGLIKDKLGFYENIDQPINMTSMPTLYWTYLDFGVGLSGRDVSLDRSPRGRFRANH